MVKVHSHRYAAGLALALFIVLSGFLASTTAAQENRRLMPEPSGAPYNLAQFADFLIEDNTTLADWESRLRLTDLLALEDDVFTPVGTRQIGFGWQESIVHVRIPIGNPTADAQEWALSFNQTKWGNRRVYLVLDGEPPPTDPLFIYSDDVPWRALDRLLYVTFTLPPGETGTLYVSYQNLASSAPMTLEVPESYEERRLLNDLWIYTLIGFVVGVTILTVSLIGVLQQNVAIYYAGYVVCATVHFCFILDLFHPSPLLSAVAGPFASFFWWAAFSLAFYLLFQRAYFANDPKIGPRYRAMLVVVIAINIALLFAHAFMGLPFAYYVFWSFVCLAVIATNGLVAVVQRIIGRWFFAIGCLCLTTTVVPLTLSDLLTAHYTYEEVALFALYGIAIEAVTLSGAMFAKVRKISAEREMALQSELELTRDKLNAVRRMAAAAHDIQQPLTSLRMALADKDRTLEQYRDIDGAIDYLDQIVRTQMADAKSDLFGPGQTSGTSSTDFDLALVFVNLKSMFEEEADAKGLSLRVVPTQMRLSADPLDVTRILSNIVSNAIRNTESGGILIGVRRRGAFARIDVCDTGPGLSQDARAELEKPFVRNGVYDGQGLGLSIVRQICEKRGLLFHFSSRPNRGTVFHLFVPRADLVEEVPNAPAVSLSEL